MILDLLRDRRPTRRTRVPKRFAPAVDGLERREVLSSAALALPHAAPHVTTPAAPATLTTTSLVTDLKFAITNITKTSANHLSAVGTLTGDVLGHKFVMKNVQIPLAITSTPAPAKAVGHITPAATTSILHLSLGPVNLNLLGLNVKLDNCKNGPVTVNVSAVSGPGNLLGNLLTSVSNLLNPATPVGTTLGSLNRAGSNALTSALTTILNDVTKAKPTAGTATTPAATTPAATQILDLHLNPIHLNLLGLHVDTSSICLDVSAIPGTGNLLGNLLTDVAGLLNGPNPLSGLAKVTA